ncbi:hypothetical protein [Actinoalloteichus hymeniacidonis]|uniref:hypothetical protein n=1 Tax=Actinoalloteichus hymeniacidonis TaxID=340345 RepID=UPI001841AAC5|nr:hypothetical protein [Actinoalloteichus hymeniacidonis]MBB5907618.1 Tol biopolymer transport system component [Actinoalloteichus hymeniacidonis]
MAQPPPEAPPDIGRIAYAGTEHRSLGIVQEQYGGTVSIPLFGEGPTHFDQDPSARGDLLVFTSLRDEARPQVYLRNPDGSVRRLTEGRDAAAPELSPDRTRVVFESTEPHPGGTGVHTQLWSVGVDGEDMRPLTDTTADEKTPTFSPDGTMIAFSADLGDGRGREIYQRPVSGGAVQRVSDEPEGAALDPQWHPTDEMIAYTLDPSGNGDPAAVEGMRIRLFDLAENLVLPLLGGDQESWNSRSPAWGIEGNTLLFVSRQTASAAARAGGPPMYGSGDGAGGAGEHPPGGTPAEPGTGEDRVYEVPTDGCLPYCGVPDLVSDEERDIDVPTWLDLPQGPHPIIERTTSADPYTVTLQDVRPDGADPRDLGLVVLREDPAIGTDSRRMWYPNPGFDPWTHRQAYSPDGSTLVVTRFEDTDSGRVQRLWLVDADGSNPRPLPVADRESADWETDATFSPDGEFIAFVRRRPGGIRPEAGLARIVVVAVDTGAVRFAVAPPPEFADQEDTQPAWSPDGSAIAFTRGLVTGGFDDEQRDNHIWTVSVPDPTVQVDLSAAACGFDCDVADDSAAFSPDGRRVLFNREHDALLTVDVAGGDCTVVLPSTGYGCQSELITGPTDGPFQPRDAAFSPDGGSVVFTSRRDGDPQTPEALEILDLATGESTVLTGELPGRQKEPSWQRSTNLSTTAPTDPAPIEVGEAVEIVIPVHNEGPAPAPTTELILTFPPVLRPTGLTTPQGECVLDGLRCDLGLLEPGESVEVVVEAVGTDPGPGRIDWTVGSSVLESNQGDNEAGVPIAVEPPATEPPPDPPGPPEPPNPPEPPDVPAPPRPPSAFPPLGPVLAGPAVTVAIEPDPSYVGGTVTVRYTVTNDGPIRATGLQLRPGLPASVPLRRSSVGCSRNLCILGDLVSGGTSTVRFVLAPTEAIRTPVAALLTTTGSDDDPDDNRDDALLRVLQPRIVAVPDVGDPGFVTSVRGIDFPPGDPVELTWDPGLTAPAAPTRPRADGTFAAQLLVVPKDGLGPRLITASGAGFASVDTDFLVVASTMSPPDLGSRR